MSNRDKFLYHHLPQLLLVEEWPVSEANENIRRYKSNGKNSDERKGKRSFQFRIVENYFEDEIKEVYSNSYPFSFDTLNMRLST